MPEEIPRASAPDSIPAARQQPYYGCLYRPPAPVDRAEGRTEGAASVATALVAIAREFSPRYERHGDNLVAIDLSGLDRLLGTPRTIGEELRREAAARGARLHVAIAATRSAALVLAYARPGLTVVGPGEEAAALAPVPLRILTKIDLSTLSSGRGLRTSHGGLQVASAVSAFTQWGIRTLGELAALPPADLSARLGQEALLWRTIARGEDPWPLVPELPEERFESSLDLDWPIEGLEPLSFVLTRLLEPLSMRLERRDRGAAGLHVRLRLVTHAHHARRLELPAPIRDVRTLRTLALLDLESHPPPAAIEGVTVVIDPTPGRVLQHRLFAQAYPTPEQLSTLLARLGALMGRDRVGAVARVDSYRPGAFAMRPFATDHERDAHRDRRASYGPAHGRGDVGNGVVPVAAASVSVRVAASAAAEAAIPAMPIVAALRRCRQPVPARVAVEAGRPIRVTTDRRSFAGGAVLQSAGPWRTSGEWWRAARPAAPGATPTRVAPESRHRARPAAWDRDEWDVALSDGAVYRIFRDRETDGWFIDAIVD